MGKKTTGSKRIDRRNFLHRASLAAGGLGASTLLPQLSAPAKAAATRDPAATTIGDTASLDAHVERLLRWQVAPRANWVRARPGIDHDVLVVGGGQSGLGISYRLRQGGVGRVEVIDLADPGKAGVWKTIARMQQLRTSKTIVGPELENAALGFRAWFETLHGPEAFDALDRIPRESWGDYLAWFQKVTDTSVRYRTRLTDIEPHGDLLRVELESEGARRTVVVRKLVLASGYAGAGGASVPGFLRQLPDNVWAHSSSPIRFDQLAGKSVAVIGAGSSAFDAAATALEAGANEVHMFSRDPYLNYAGGRASAGAARPAPDRGHASVTELADDLPDAVRWRNFMIRDRGIASVPLDSLERAVRFENFHVYINSEWTAATVDRNGKVSGTVAGKTRKFDYVIAGTGYRIDLSTQPELARIHKDIALWRDRYQPGPGEESPAGGAYPYLGPSFEFLPREGSDAEYLRNIHCYNLAATVSFGIVVGDIPSTVHQPTLVAGIARDLYLGDVDLEANRRFLLDREEPAEPDRAPYQKALRRV